MTTHNLSPRIAIVMTVLVMLYVSFFKVYDDSDPYYTSPNERPRLFLAHAIASRGTLEVTSEVRRFGTSYDMAKVGNKYFSDKPPLPSFVAAPIVKAYILLKKNYTESELLWAVKVCLYAPFSALFFWLVFTIFFSAGITATTALFLAWAVLFGTPISTYFTVFFSHSITATLLLAFFLAIRKSITQPEIATLFLTGLLGGLSFLNEYQSAITILIFTIYLFIQLPQRSKILPYILGGSIVAAAFILYNMAAFGHPITAGVAHESLDSVRESHDKGMFGVTHPKKEAVFEVLLSVKMGIFLLSPFLIFALFGIWRRWKESRAETIALILVILGWLYINTSFFNWHGGWAFGSRYGVPGIAFLGIFAGYGIAALATSLRWRFVSVTLVLASCIIFTLANGLRPLAPEEFSNPLANYYLPAIITQFITYKSLLTPFGFSPVTATAVFMALFGIVTLILSYRFIHISASRVALAFSAALVYVACCMIPSHGSAYETKFFYWMQKNNRFAKDAALKEHAFDGKFKEAVDDLRRLQNAPKN